MRTRLIHCFGTSISRFVSTELAIDMLEASGCRHLIANTHDIAHVGRGDDLPVGYGSATVRSVLSAWSGDPLSVVLNINLATTAAEAVARTHRAIELRDEKIVKLEVLDADHVLSNDLEVVTAVAELGSDSSLEIWPLVTASPGAVRELEALGCPLIRVMASRIGSGEGIRPQSIPEIETILASTRVPVMLDGGIGCPDHVVQALELGFDYALVNSCLFADGGDPVARLRKLRDTIKAMPRRPAMEVTG